MLAVTVFNERQHEQKVLPLGAARLGKTIGDSGYGQFFVMCDSSSAETQVAIQLAGDSGRPMVNLNNIGSEFVELESGKRLAPGKEACLELPTVFSIDNTYVHVFVFEDADSHDLSLEGTPKSGSDIKSQQGKTKRNPSPGADTLAAWLDSLSQLQKAVAGSKELYDLAAHAVVNPGGLDGGMILLPTSEGCEIAASHIPYPEQGVGFREDLIVQAADARETVFDATDSQVVESKFEALHYAVVCPVVGENNEVLAVVYGFRSMHRLNNRRGVRALEAQFVKVVADSLSAGMIRLEAEAEAARNSVLLSQAFSPNVARQLQANPEFLNPQSCEVSVLFADLRGFSDIAETIGSEETYKLLSDLMDRLTNAVTDLDGVVIDYYGDGISAFWNAPIYQPEHALLACQAGLEMLNLLPGLNEIWASRIGRELEIGIGVHTGEARVGNAGSKSRLKYGPRGSTVNIASRLETATKQIGIPMLISGSTAECVGDLFVTRRIARSLLKGIKQPTDIYQLIGRDEVSSVSNLEDYNRALCQFERGELTEALLGLTQLKLDTPDDPVTDFLLRLVTEEKRQALSKSGMESLAAPAIEVPNQAPNWNVLLNK